MKLLLLATGLIVYVVSFGQTYTSYFTGNATDVTTSPQKGVCLMGGASEHDEAMKWFLQRADGGDVLVLRTSGSDGYNNYMYSSLGVTLNSVETIVFNSATASNDSYIHQKISNAEAIWFAGGDQWNYISYWRNTPIDSLINEAIQNRNIVIGGTSAGMAILGGYYFSAQNGTVTSTTALANPYDNNVTVDSSAFLKPDYLKDVITDTHYDNPDRKGRHVTFLARIFMDYGIEGKGIACDEYTAVCIDDLGIARVYGEYPTYDENAYFIQTNCEIADVTPENCSVGNPLNWNLGGQAIKVYNVKGTDAGTNTFDLNDWETGNGGVWRNWYVDNGVLFQIVGNPIDCSISGISEPETPILVNVFPNPSGKKISVVLGEKHKRITATVFTVSGQLISQQLFIDKSKFEVEINASNGIYLLEIETNSGTKSMVKITKE